MFILALDPGLTTGVCLIETDNAIISKGFRVVLVDEIPWVHRFSMLRALIEGTYGFLSDAMPRLPEVVVVESFRLRQGRALEQSGSEMPSSQVIGIIGTFLYLNSRSDTLVFQEPSDIASVAVPHEDSGFTFGSEHKADAYKHARYYYLTQIHFKDGTVRRKS